MLPFQMRRGHKFAAPFSRPLSVLAGCPDALTPIKGQGNLSRGRSHNWQFAGTCAPDPNSSERRKKRRSGAQITRAAGSAPQLKDTANTGTPFREKRRTPDVLSGEAAQLPSEIIKPPHCLSSCRSKSAVCKMGQLKPSAPHRFLLR